MYIPNSLRALCVGVGILINQSGLNRSSCNSKTTALSVFIFGMPIGEMFSRSLHVYSDSKYILLKWAVNSNGFEKGARKFNRMATGNFQCQKIDMSTILCWEPYHLNSQVWRCLRSRKIKHLQDASAKNWSFKKY